MVDFASLTIETLSSDSPCRSHDRADKRMLRIRRNRVHIVAPLNAPRPTAVLRAVAGIGLIVAYSWLTVATLRETAKKQHEAAQRTSETNSQPPQLNSAQA